MVYVMLVLMLAGFQLLPTGGAATCEWAERFNIALERLVEPAFVLREYSDVKTTQECYARCCGLEKEGCNVAAFLSYGAKDICVNVRCEPFDSCIWGPYPASVAAVITSEGATTAPLNRSTMADMNTTVTRPATTPPGPAPTGSGRPNATSSTAAPNGNVSITTDGATTNNSTPLNRPWTKHSTRRPYKAKDFNVHLPQKELPDSRPRGKTPTTVQRNGVGVSPTEGMTSQGFPGVEELLPDSSSNTNSSWMGTVAGIDNVNYTVSIIIGLATCVLFLVIMFVAARRLKLFREDSHYRPLLDVHEPYTDTYSTSDFEQ